jgi:hypothetical protein
MIGSLSHATTGGVMLKLLLVAISFFLVSLTVESDVYVWRDAQGVLNYSDTPPPAVIDARGGRNAGLIAEGGRLFRIAQRQGFDRYGEGILVYEIKKISESTFAEELVTESNPTFRTGLRATHHLSTDGKTTVIDHASYSFIF